ALADLARAFSSPSAVVFRGVPGPCPPRQRDRVRVLYAGSSLSVGGRILEIVARDARRVPITVVTADPHLAACAREHRARAAPTHLLSRAIDRACTFRPGPSKTWSPPSFEGALTLRRRCAPVAAGRSSSVR